METCTRCGKVFLCEASGNEFTCWCQDLKVVAKIPLQYRSCLCKECLQEFSSTSTKSQESPLIEGQDYYLEKGLMVFTAKYHLDRGFCCGSGCRHCPYS